MKAFASTPNQKSLYRLYNLLFFKVHCTLSSDISSLFSHFSLWIYLSAQHRQYSSTPPNSLCPSFEKRRSQSADVDWLLLEDWQGVGAELCTRRCPCAGPSIIHTQKSWQMKSVVFYLDYIDKVVCITTMFCNLTAFAVVLTVNTTDLAMFQIQLPVPHLLPGACLWLTGTSLLLDHSNKTSLGRRWAV